MFRFITLLLILFLTVESHSTVWMTIPEALDTYFPNYKVKKGKIYLNKKTMARLEKTTRSEFKDKIYTYYEAYKGNKRVNTAFVDTHILRTRTETIFVVFNNKGKVQSVEVLAFYEPEEYIMTKKWLKQFDGKNLRQKLIPREDIIEVSGATISSHETTKAIRRTMGLYNLLYK
ncbi:MAG: FMN-binding protein [Thermodesulfobacteriota bacterium]|nr:FMN-binding protein [Thermodesulfobacteriota bacterium]